MAKPSLSNRLVRAAVIGAPLFIFLYGTIRLIPIPADGGNNHGLGWSLGHTLFFIAFILLGCLTIVLRQLIAAKTRLAGIIADIAMAAGLCGTAIFIWGILGDIFVRVHLAAPVPGILQAVGPLLFIIGVLILLTWCAVARPHTLPFRSPVLVLAGFLMFSLSLNLLSVGAIMLFGGLLPIMQSWRRISIA